MESRRDYPEFEGSCLTYLKAVCLKIIYLNQQMEFVFIMLNDQPYWEEGKMFSGGLQMLA